MELYLFGIGLIISLLLHFLAERSQIVLFIFCKKSSILPVFYQNPFLTSNVQAQQGFTVLFDSVSVNINRSDATTGILYDRVLPFSNLKQFAGAVPFV